LCGAGGHSELTSTTTTMRRVMPGNSDGTGPGARHAPAQRYVWRATVQDDGTRTTDYRAHVYPTPHLRSVGCIQFFRNGGSVERENE